MNLKVEVGGRKKNKIKKCLSSIFSRIVCIYKINSIKAGGRRAKKINLLIKLGLLEPMLPRDCEIFLL